MVVRSDKKMVDTKVSTIFLSLQLQPQKSERFLCVNDSV